MECFSISGAIKGEKGKKKILEIVLGAGRSVISVILSAVPSIAFLIFLAFFPSRHDHCR